MLDNAGEDGDQFFQCPGEVAEWSKATVLKTVDRLCGPGVRIPPSPPHLIAATVSKPYTVVGNTIRKP